MWPRPQVPLAGFTTTNIDSALLLCSEYDSFISLMRRDQQMAFSCPWPSTLTREKQALPLHRPSMTSAKPIFRLLAP
jgi:hypothetical protein